MKKSTICKSKKADFLSFMQNQIQEKKMRNKIKTSANYQSSLRSFTHFLQTKGYCRSVSFESITEELIASYETYLQHERGITKNSSSFYIRTLHAAYKKGIAMLNLKLRDPFGNVYTGVDKTRKRAVNIDVIIKLMQYKYGIQSRYICILLFRTRYAFHRLRQTKKGKSAKRTPFLLSE